MIQLFSKSSFVSTTLLKNNVSAVINPCSTAYFN